MFKKNIKIDKWIGTTTNRRQGASSKSIKLGNNSIGKLSFTVSSKSPYWRAGFKLCPPNSSDLPLRNDDNSLLFHVGARKEHDKMSLTIYVNSERQIHKRLEYEKDAEITIAFEVNENNFITCLVNDVQVFHQRVESAIFKKVYLLAWGDSDEGSFRQYEVTFKKITSTLRQFKQNTTSENLENKNLFNNHWVKGISIAVIGAVLAGLILAKILGIGQPQKNDSYSTESHNQNGGITAGQIVNLTTKNDESYSSNQTVTNSVDGNNTLNLDNIGTLTFLPGVPIGSSTTEMFHSGGDSVAMALNVVSKELPLDENKVKQYSTGKFDPDQVYFFDTEENQSYLISVSDRVFRITLQKINLINSDYIKASTTLDEFQYKYQFGISETR